MSDPTYNELLPDLYAFGSLLNVNAVSLRIYGANGIIIT